MVLSSFFKMVPRRIPFVVSIVISLLVVAIDIGIVLFNTFLFDNYNVAPFHFGLSVAIQWFLVGWAVNVAAMIVDRNDEKKVFVIYSVVSWLLYGVSLATLIFNPIYAGV